MRVVYRVFLRELSGYFGGVVKGYMPIFNLAINLRHCGAFCFEER